MTSMTSSVEQTDLDLKNSVALAQTLTWDFSGCSKPNFIDLRLWVDVQKKPPVKINGCLPQSQGYIDV